MSCIVEDKLAKRASFKLPPLTIIEEEGETTPKGGSIRRKLMQQIKRVAAHHNKNELKASFELESARSKRFSLKQASFIYQELLLTRLCQNMEQKPRLAGGNVSGFFVEVPKQLEGRVNSLEIDVEFTENDKMEYEKEFMPNGMDSYCHTFVCCYLRNAYTI